MFRVWRFTPLRALVLMLGLAYLIAFRAVPSHAAATLHVPADYPSIQAAVDAASAGDTIEVASGTYFENVTIRKSVSVVAATYDPLDPRGDSTIIEGGKGGVAFSVVSGIDPPPSVIGFTIRNGKNGIFTRSPLTVRYCYFLGGVDSLQSTTGGGGVFSDNVFEGSKDDAIDINHPNTDIFVTNNEFVRAGGDGIEIRLNDDAITETADITIRGNAITQSKTDGIQLIDYFQDTNRVFHIEGNLIRGVGKAAIGLLDNGLSGEDFRAASIRERINVFNNTFVNNNHGISGGDNLIALNNIFAGHALALKNVDADSIAAYNLFWGNTADSQGSIVDGATTVSADPMLDLFDHLRAGSPAIDAGVAHFEWGGEVVMDMPPSAFEGVAPDLGWDEFVPSSDPAPSITDLDPTSGVPGDSVTISGAGFSGATHVRFGDRPATFAIDSDSQITAIVPSGASTAPVSVIGPGGTGTSTANFTVATPVTVTVVDNAFQPKSQDVDQGRPVSWMFQGQSLQSATDAVGLGPGGDPLFDSGPRGAGEVFEFVFRSAGRYAYRSTQSALTGTIRVPVVVTPTSGTTQTPFVVTWSSEAMPGFLFSTQYRFKASGSGTWTKWASLGPPQTDPSGGFLADQGAGTYQFRSRLQNQATGRTAQYSLPTSVAVTST